LKATLLSLVILCAVGVAVAVYMDRGTPWTPASSAGEKIPASPAQMPELVSASQPALPLESGEPAAQASPIQTPAVLPASASTNNQASAPNPHRHLKRFFRTQLRPSLNEIASDFQAGEPARISVPLFDGNEAVVVVDNFTPYGERAGAFTGKVEGDEGSFVSIAFFEDAESGSIQFPAQNLVYAIQPEPDGSVLVGEVDIEAVATCGTCAGLVPGRGP